LTDLVSIIWRVRKATNFFIPGWNGRIRMQIREGKVLSIGIVSYLLEEHFWRPGAVQSDFHKRKVIWSALSIHES
jgi:hypothetical protein